MDKGFNYISTLPYLKAILHPPKFQALLLQQTKTLCMLQGRAQTLLQLLFACVSRQEQVVEAGVCCWQPVAISSHPAELTSNATFEVESH
jgi:hypothetical protein